MSGGADHGAGDSRFRGRCGELPCGAEFSATTSVRRRQIEPCRGTPWTPPSTRQGRRLAVGDLGAEICEQPMRPLFRLLMAAALVSVCFAAPAAMAGGPQQPEVDALLQHLDDLYRSKSSIARIEIDVTTTRSTRNMRLRAWTRGEEEVLVLIEAPPRDAGTATLRVGDNLWNYLPKIARTIRVPPAAMLGSWMGTDFTNDDLVKESSLRKDFTGRIDRRSDAPPGWWLRLDVKPGVVGRWARIDLLVSDERLPIEERHYDRKGRLARTMYFDDVTMLGGRKLPAHIVLVPADSVAQRTEMRYLEVEFDVSLSDDTFSLSRLERTRQ